MLTRTLPVRDGLGPEAGFCVMMGYQLRLGLGNVGKLRRQHLGNMLMILLARALQERLVGGILDEGVLEDLLAARRQTALVDQFGIH